MTQSELEKKYAKLYALIGNNRLPHGTIAKAARKLEVTPPTIQHHLKNFTNRTPEVLEAINQSLSENAHVSEAVQADFDKSEQLIKEIQAKLS